MSDRACCHACGAPTGDTATVCPPCAGGLTRDLADIHGTPRLHGLADDLDIAIARAASWGGDRTRSSEAPLLIDPRASEARTVLHSTLATWCRVLLDERGDQTPEDTLGSMARWLAARVEAIRHAQWGPELVDEVHAAVRQAYAAVDRPTQHTYLGPCPDCTHSLWAPPRARTARCRTEGCDGEVDVAAWWADLPQRAGHLTAGATELADLVTALGRPLAAGTVWSWASRRRIRPVPGTDPPRYRVADALELLARRDERMSA
jgi:hypothetical protein